MHTSLNDLLKIKYPIIQAGMVWCSGWKLASAVSNEGGLGVIGAGSMNTQTLKYHIQQCKLHTNKPFAVNLPLFYHSIKEQIEIIIEEKVPIVITSAGNPQLYTSLFKANGIKVIHVVSSLKFGLKAEAAGVDAIVGEGFEAGGHNGKDETTTFCLIPLLKKHIKIPIIAAGGIASGAGILAAFSLGASGVQIGTLFASAEESSAHQNFKSSIIKAKEGDTHLVLKQLTPVRLFKNSFYEKVIDLENKGASIESLQIILGKGRAKAGIFEGDLTEGEIEFGQCSALIDQNNSVKTIMQNIIHEYVEAKNNVLSI